MKEAITELSSLSYCLWNHILFP